MVQFDEEKHRLKLAQLRAEEEEDLARIFAEKNDTKYIDLTTTPIQADALRLIKQEEAEKAGVAVFNRVNKKLDVAIQSQTKPETLEFLESLKTRGYEPEIYMASSKSLHYAWDRYKDIVSAHETKRGSIDISSADINEFLSQVKNPDYAKEFLKTHLSSKGSSLTSRVIEIFIAIAIATKASDIHIEPEESTTRLRLRLDGILTDFAEFDKKIYTLLLSRIKIVSGLKVNIKTKAQDGRFSIELDNKDIEVRTSVIPSGYGESIVLRILNPENTLFPLEELGIDKDLYVVLEKEMKRPNGMILTTGPTGSGKTTMLYALLRKIYTPEIKVVTIEDPIEYHLEGVVQTQVGGKNSYDFASGLRAILRQDPDVIMVGEIRDKETATTAINASLTGHLVLSTLHTNNAAGAFPRLIDLGVSPKVIGAAVRVAMAQRLVRVLCNSCKEKVPPTKEEKEIIEKIQRGMPEHRQKDVQTEFVWKAKGCDVCGKSGFKDRIGIYEAIMMTESVEEEIRKSPSEKSMWEVAEDQNLLTMREDGILKVSRGITTLEELERVIDLFF